MGLTVKVDGVTLTEAQVTEAVAELDAQRKRLAEEKEAKTYAQHGEVTSQYGTAGIVLSIAELKGYLERGAIGFIRVVPASGYSGRGTGEAVIAGHNPKYLKAAVGTKVVFEQRT